MTHSHLTPIQEAARRAGVAVIDLQPSLFIELEQHGRREFIAENQWPLNSAGSMLLARDKAATHALLVREGIASIPQIQIRKVAEQPLDQARAFYEEHGGCVVLKDNFGSLGRDVHFVRDVHHFQRTLIYFLERYGQVNCSQRVDAANEYRCVILNGVVQLMYLKKRPVIIGDGVRSLGSLIASAQYRVLKWKHELWDDLSRVPEPEEEVVLSDQHNLSLGALPEVISPENGLYARLGDIALRSARAMNLRFCSVDIVLDQRASLYVMEVNAGVMFDVFASVSEENRKKVVHIYEHAIRTLFNIGGGQVASE